LQGVDVIPDTVGGADRTFLERLIARLDADHRVAALLLGGSHATGTADEYSDLDLTLITTDEGWESVHAERRELLSSLGEAVFLEEHTDFGFLLLLFIYAGGARGEVSLAPARDFDEVVGGPNITLFDKANLSGDRHRLNGLDDHTRRDIARRTLTWFWYDRGLLDVFLARNRLWTAHFYLERCRERCLDLAWIRDRPDVWPGGHEKAEIVLRPETLARLAPTVTPLDTDAIAAAARAVTEVYLELGPEVAERSGVEFPTKLAAVVLARLRN
jgi:predicted nucleotidyltransferase